MLQKLKKYWYIVLPVVLLAIYLLMDYVVYSAQKVAEAAAKYDNKLSGNVVPPTEYYLDRADKDAFVNSKLTNKITKPISQYSLNEKMKLMKELKTLNV